MSERRTFIDECIRGAAVLIDIDDYVDEWHELEEGPPIWKFLGMDRDEYALWVERPESLRFIVSAHRQNKSVEDVIRSHDQVLVKRPDGEVVRIVPT